MSFIDLEDEDLIDADENELQVEEENLLIDADENEDGNADNATIDTAPSKDATKVAPKKRVVRNPQPKLDYNRLNGPRGLMVLESSFKDFKYKGKRYEKEDLDAVMTVLEQWTHRLFPKFTFDDTLKKLEQLGHKRQVSNFMNRIRLDMIDDNQSFAQNDNVEDENEPEIDPFDSLTQGHSHSSSMQQDPSAGIQQSTLTAEQRERMIRNRLLAEERRLARMKAKQEEELARQLNQQDTEMLMEQHAQSQDHRESDSVVGSRENRNQPQIDLSQPLLNQSQQTNYWDNEQENLDSLLIDQAQNEELQSQLQS